MNCPKCPSKDGYKQLIDYANWFICPDCGFRCYLKHYRAQFNNNMSKELSQKQQKQLKAPCPVCQEPCQEVGDLADFKHNIVMCTNNICEFALMFDGAIIEKPRVCQICHEIEDDDGRCGCTNADAN